MTLTSTLEGSQSCTGEEITFTCTTGAPSLCWQSDQYIGTGGQLEVLCADNIGKTYQSKIYPNTVAKLVNKSNNCLDESTRMIVSELKIVVTSIGGTVTCAGDRATSNDSITFQYVRKWILY